MDTGKDVRESEIARGRPFLLARIFRFDGFEKFIHFNSPLFQELKDYFRRGSCDPP